MSLPIPMTAGEANQLIKNIITRTRPVNDQELYQALNYGIQKAVRAISAARPQFFASWVEPFTIGGGVTEYDVSGLSPSLFRPWRLVCNGNQGQSSVVLFKYASITTQEFEDAEVSTSGAVANNLLYDVLDGLLPGPVLQLTHPIAAGDFVIPVSLSDISAANVVPGSYAMIANYGTGYTPVGWTAQSPPSFAANTDYLGFILGTWGGAPSPPLPGLIVEPAMPQAVPFTTPIQIMRRRVLKIVPALQQTYTGRLWYVYTPNRLRVDGDPLPIGLADRHIDMVVSYAVGLLKRSVDDAMENRWALEATEMRSELMQDTEPISGQNSEALGSALDWIGY